MKKILFILLTVTTVMSSCTKDSKVQLEELKLENFSYGPQARNRMDVYLPKGRDKDTPVIIIIHGGAWTSGDKSDLSFVQDLLHVNRYATVNINYRYAAIGVDLDDMLGDVKAAIDQVRAQSAEWGIRDRKFVLLGHSSGAHLALLQAYGGYQPQDVVQTVISMAGPTDLTTLTGDPVHNALISTVLLGVPLGQGFSHPRFAEASPLMQVDKAIPTLLIHGSADDIVPYAQSEALNTALAGKGVAHKLVTLTGIGHEFDLDFATTAQVLGEVRTWVRAHGK